MQAKSVKENLPEEIKTAYNKVWLMFTCCGFRRAADENNGFHKVTRYRIALKEK